MNPVFVLLLLSWMTIKKVVAAVVPFLNLLQWSTIWKFIVGRNHIQKHALMHVT